MSLFKGCSAGPFLSEGVKFCPKPHETEGVKKIEKELGACGRLRRRGRRVASNPSRISRLRPTVEKGLPTFLFSDMRFRPRMRKRRLGGKSDGAIHGSAREGFGAVGRWGSVAYLDRSRGKS